MSRNQDDSSPSVSFVKEVIRVIYIIFFKDENYKKRMSGCKDIFNVIKLSLIFMQRNLVALSMFILTEISTRDNYALIVGVFFLIGTDKQFESE